MKPLLFFKRRFLTSLAVGVLSGGVLAAQSQSPRVDVRTTVIVENVRSEAADFRVERMVEGLQNPWGMAFLPDGGYLVGEKAGRMWLVRGTTVSAVDGLPAVEPVGQGGLLDIALHPDFARNGLLFFSYSARTPEGLGTRVARARLVGTRLVEVRDIFVMRGGTGAGQHFGSRIVVPGDGTLVFSIGDRGRMELAQRLDVHAGKTLRIREDGGVPSDNPFVGRAGALAEIFTYGNRNAQGMAIQPDSGLIWQHEHGPRGGDEVNILRAGANYGWPLVTHGVSYSGAVISTEVHRPGIEPPLLHWTPSIAPSGMSFYSGDLFPAWRGNLFVGALAGQQLRRLVVDGERIAHQETLLQGLLGRIRTVLQGPEGALWLMTDGPSASLVRIVPAR